MKKHIIKYILDFLVIVLGISVSFWVNKIQNNKENKINEIHVYEDIRMELNELTEMINERTDKFTFDLGLVNKVLSESLDANYNYNDLFVAVTDYRGFEPKIEIYSSLKYDGGLKCIISYATPWIRKFDFLTCILVLYDCFMVPFKLAFGAG